MIINRRVDRWFTITGEDPLWTNGFDRPSRFIPDQAHAWRDRDAEPTIEVTGQIIHAITGKTSKKRGKASYGRYACPLDQAPDWVQDIAKQMDIL